MLFNNIKKRSREILQAVVCFVCLIFFGFIGKAQSTYIPLNDKQYDILNRLEIKAGWQGDIFSAVKPYKRKDAVALVQKIDSLEHLDISYADLSAVDKYNMQCLLMDNSEWSKPSDTYLSRKPVFGANGIYKTKDNLFEVHNSDLFLAINPVIYFAAGREKGNGSTLYQNTRGLTLRGILDNKIGFNLFFTDNQERDPSYVMSYVSTNNALPGQGFYKQSRLNKTGTLDYFDARGYTTWNVDKYIDMQFGFDKNIVADGYRSLLLSDFSSSATFLKTNFKIWKLNYENILMELYAPHTYAGDLIFPKKYARFSDLSINATKWFNAGIFEGAMFDRENNFSLQYLIPVMFFKPVGSAGNNENEIVGLHAKADIVHHVQVYGQLMFDQLNSVDIFSNSWSNRSGFQVGFKYIDVFGLKNVDVQAEMNQVRPYTYAYNDSVGNYSHYNQSIAHPLGANFRELTGIIKMQPLPRLRLQAQFTHYFQGLDSAGINYGSNIFEDYDDRPANSNFAIGAGNLATCNLFAGVASYEIKENMFIDLSGIYRTYKVESTNTTTNSISIYLSFRWNIVRRDFTF